MRTGPGFTLIEMVTVIALTGIIALLVGRNISRPVAGFLDLSKRAQLVDDAELALRRMSREIRLALPNSVRLTDGSTQNLQNCAASAGSICSVEILRTLDGGRYRLKSGGGGDHNYCATPDNDKLSFTKADDCFEIIGGLTGSTLPAVSPTATQADCLNGNTDCLVIFNTGQAGANAYDGDNIAAIRAATANSITFDISGGSVTRFPYQSPEQRFQIVDTPVSFVCDTNAGTVTRDADYAISAIQSISPGGSSALLADNVSSCSVTYEQGTNSRNGLLIVALSLTATDTEGNQNNVRLVQQIQVPNSP